MKTILFWTVCECLNDYSECSLRINLEFCTTPSFQIVIIISSKFHPSYRIKDISNLYTSEKLPVLYTKTHHDPVRLKNITFIIPTRLNPYGGMRISANS